MKRLFCIMLFCAAVPVGAATNDEMHEMLVPEIPEVVPYFDLNILREPEQGTDQAASHKSTLYDVFIQATLFPSISDRQVSIQVKSRMQDLAQGLTLGNSGRLMPDPLYDPGIGATYRMKISDDKLLGLNLSVSSASEAPFNDGHGPDIGGSIFLRLNSREKNAWILYLHYLSTREYLPEAPVPGVGYLYHSSDGKFTMLFGAPYAEMKWTPSPRVHFQADWQFPREFRSEAGFALMKEMILHANFDWRQNRFRNKNRVADGNMLNYHEKIFYGGIRYMLGDGVFVDAYAGKAIDRFWFEGEDYDDRNFNRINVDDGTVFGFRFRSTF